MESGSIRTDGSLGLFVVLVLAGAYFFSFFPLDFLGGESSFWLAENGDIAQYRAGFNAFFAEPWHWPLLRIDSLNWPRGTLVTFVDGIPLFSLFLKTLVPKSFFPFNPFGWWVGLCYLLQGVGAWWIAREARTQSWATLAGLTLLLLMSPALAFRLGHISLMSHWLILFGFALYMRSGNRGEPSEKGWILLLLGAFYINIYIFAMCSLLFFADTLRFWRVSCWKRSLALSIFPFWLIACTLFFTMYPLPGGSGSGDSGFGFYSMNVLAPFWGGRFLVWPFPLGTEGQGEGFNYLGLGVLFLAALALMVRACKDRAFTSRHGILLLFLVLACLYALSNKVYVGNRLLWEWPLPSFVGPITGTFRVSGRFFWVVGYGVVVFAVLTLARFLSKSVFLVLMVLCLLLQWVDLEPSRDQLRGVVNRPALQLVDYPKWDAFLGDTVETLYFFPEFLCGSSSPFDSLLPTMLYASKRRMNITTGYISRYRPLRGDPAFVVVHSDSAHAAYVFVRKEFPDVEQIRSFFGPGVSLDCGELDFAWVVRVVSQTGNGREEEK